MTRLNPGGTCLVGWDYDDDVNEDDEDDDDDMRMEYEEIDAEDAEETEVPAQFLELTDESDPRAATTGARHPTARAAVAAARGTSGGDVSSFMSSSMPGARDFWIGAATYRSSRRRGCPRARDAAAAAAAAEPIPADERAALAEAFVARLLPALLAAHRVASRETTRRASLRLVTSALRRLTSTDNERSRRATAPRSWRASASPSGMDSPRE